MQRKAAILYGAYIASREGMRGYGAVKYLASIKGMVKEDAIRKYMVKTQSGVVYYFHAQGRPVKISG